MVRVRLSLLDKINLFINVYIRLFLGIWRVSWYSPFIILALFQLFGLVIFLWYYAPVLINIIKPILSVFLPDGAFHYPQYYLALSSIYAAYESFVLGPTLWIILLGAAVFRFDKIQTGDSRPTLQEGFQTGFDRYLRILFVWLIETIFIVLIIYVPTVALKEMTQGSPNMAAAVGFVLQSAGLLITALLLYAVIGIIVDNKRLTDAVIDGVITFFRFPIITFLIVFIPNIFRLVINAMLSGLAPRIIERMNPEILPNLLLVYIILGIFINYFIYGAAVIFYRRIE